MNGWMRTDSVLIRTLTKTGELIVLNVVFLLSCLPLVTIGAGCTAMYTVCSRMEMPKEGTLLSSYFRAFFRSFRQSCAAGLVLAVGIAGMLFNLSLVGGKGILTAAAVAGLLLVTGVAVYTFPLISRFENPLTVTFRNALLLLLANPLRSVLMIGVSLLPFYLFFFKPVVFLELGFWWVSIYFAAASLLKNKLLAKTFEALEKECLGETM